VRRTGELARATGPQRAEQPLRVSSTFRTTLTMAPTQVVPDRRAGGGPPRPLRHGRDECAALSEIFKSDLPSDLGADLAFPRSAPMPSRKHPQRHRNYELRPMRQQAR